MYGVLLSSISHYVINRLGNEYWEQVKSKVGINYPCFIHKKVYSESLVYRVINAIQEVCHVSKKELMIEIGKYFMESLEGSGFSKILRVLGRNFSDYLSGLDNLHEYVRFSFPRLKAPSFTVEEEREDGVVLRYRSRRKGYEEYVMGLIIKSGQMYYNIVVQIKLIEDQSSKDFADILYDLKFDNKKYMSDRRHNPKISRFPVSTSSFLKLFPFHLVFDKNLTVKAAGNVLRRLIPDIIGQSADEIFLIIKPLIDFQFEEILGHLNSVFEIQSLYETRKSIEEDVMSITTHLESINESVTSSVNNEVVNSKSRIVLKGQMLKIQDYVLFIGVPMIANIDHLGNYGLYLNDLSVHDSSRELLIAGAQQNAELKLALDRETRRGQELEQCMSKLEIEKQKREDLLYQLIPKEVCDKLNDTQDPRNICETCESVTLLFTDIVGFTNLCTKISPMEVVGVLNLLYTSFDRCIEQCCVYKVETIGDAYLICGGLPVRTATHTRDIVDTAILMMREIKSFKNPFTDDVLQMRAGIHTGSVVAGIVDKKMPRYCLFGEICNTTKKLETYSKPMHIQISELANQSLHDRKNLKIEPRKDKGIESLMGFPTYWIWPEDLIN